MLGQKRNVLNVTVNSQVNPLYVLPALYDLKNILPIFIEKSDISSIQIRLAIP